MHFADKPFPVAVVIGFDDREITALEKVFARSGWSMAKPGNAEVAQLILISGVNFCAEGPGRDGKGLGAIRVMVGGGADSAVDDRLPADAFLESLADMLPLWRPAGCEGLVRMQDAFGRAALVPIVEGLRGELAAAVALIDAQEAPDGHRLAGLAGTLGFAGASQAFNALHHGTGDAATARRHARTASVAIDRWLRGDDRSDQ